MRASSLGMALAWAAAGQAVGADAPPPPAPLSSLETALGGTWTISETFAPSAQNADSIATPNGGTGHGVEVWRAGPGGYTFMEEEHNYTPQGDVFIVGYMWWDATKQAFGGMECNSQWPQTCDLRAALSRVVLDWDGRRLVVDFRDAKDPNRLAWHEVFFNITPNSFDQTGDVGMPDGTLRRWVTIHATRVPDTSG